MIDSTGKDRLLLRNPAGYRSGFWSTFRSGGQVFCGMSTEEQSYSVKRKEYKQKRFELALEYTPEGHTAPMAMFDIALWTFNRPFLLMRYRTTNISDSPLEDLRVYNLMDFDIGGPPSYRDDMARFDPETGVMRIWDEAPLHVELASRPKPTGWEISPPLKLKVTDTYRDLKNNLELGPRDVAVAVQWNLGTLDKGESKFVDVVISSGISPEEAEALIPTAWELFSKKMR